MLRSLQKYTRSNIACKDCTYIPRREIDFDLTIDFNGPRNLLMVLEFHEFWQGPIQVEHGYHLAICTEGTFGLGSLVGLQNVPTP